ncbi:hypothetical protein HYH02_008002 [Chlamydomonas schloesseri]|nr:hypothetical protein HYH02_008002 [Chlamydomonas schloesseri]|eukprot:KAG2446845.1 hypothetical protein HYH02_008002 [Chlamydomonas schloesseri]
MAAVVCAFAVMLSAAIFVSHVLRTGQQVDSIITYLSQALWVDTAFNEYTFVAQCFFTALAVVLYVCLNYPGTLAWVLAGLCGLMVLSLLVMVLWSTTIFHATGQREWDEIVAAEEEFRAYAKATAVAAPSNGGCGEAGCGAELEVKAAALHRQSAAKAANDKPRVAADIGSDGDG